MVEAETLGFQLLDLDRPRVLVVEDEERIADLLRRQLEAGGFEVTVAARAATALSALEYGLPDLVLLDLILPDVNGYQLCAILRRLYSHATLPIVILTGVEQCTEGLQHEAAGADAYLRKPYDAAELIQTIRTLVT
jgi:DNA-binding response OmpR family regulator